MILCSTEQTHYSGHSSDQIRTVDHADGITVETERSKDETCRAARLPMRVSITKKEAREESVLAVPADDLEDLEWLSHFCEDSFSEFSLQHVTDDKKPQISHHPNRAEPPVSFNRPLTKSKRSKRSRATISRVWSVGSLPTTATTTTTPPTELSSLSSCSSSSPTSSSSNSCVTGSQAVVDLVRAAGKGKAAGPGRRQKRKLGGVEAPQRRCSHCGVVKTPQWRTGPNGAKTLCNACGVRFKSGRLLPEYRPACSPTFSSAVHSNNHRKVLEMRRKKEMVLLGPGPGPVQSF
ncbi:hypothetical protein Scep_000564 [Stephania cephalantha]|uniref:GATA transcription factor n=1 Tax=Stephania cephalantha TaxID=152367 RepID=A0AAP0L6D5_9MAGN